MFRNSPIDTNSPVYTFITRFLLIVATSLFTAVAAVSQEVSWERILPDLEFSQVTVKANPFLASEVLLFRSKLKSYRLGVIKSSDWGAQRSMIRQLAKSAHAVLAVNANFFDESGKPLGLIVSRGITSQPMHRGGNTLSGIFAVLTSGVRIMQRKEFSATGVLEAVQAGPRLIENSNRVRGVSDSSPFSRRTGVCIDSRGSIVIYCVSSGVLGMTLSQVQDLLLSPNVACVDALNFDGGGSSQLYFDARFAGAPGDLNEINVHGTDPIPVAVGLFPAVVGP